jgi:hypothetical protein
MKLYNIKLRLAGSPLDEVRKGSVTSAEITVLKDIHGADALAEIIAAGEVDRAADAERDRLEQVYGERRVTKVFGAPQPRIEDEIVSSVEAPELDVDMGQARPARPRRARADELPPPPAAARAGTADAFA